MTNTRKLRNEELNRPSPAQFKDNKKIPVVVALDDVRSLHNVGAIFRCCDAFAVERLLLCGITGTPPRKEISKTALGADESVAWEYHADILQVLHIYRKKHYGIICIEQTTRSQSLYKAFPQKTRTSPKPQQQLLIFGHETRGISENVVQTADESIHIPQFGTKHSLNVSVSAGIVLWELAKQHHTHSFTP